MDILRNRWTLMSQAERIGETLPRLSPGTVADCLARLYLKPYTTSNIISALVQAARSHGRNCGYCEGCKCYVYHDLEIRIGRRQRPSVHFKGEVLYE